MKDTNLDTDVTWWNSQFERRKAFIASQIRRRAITKDGYTYKSFDDSKSIFVHIPKTAGLSITEALYGNRAGGHASLRNYVLTFEPSVLRQYFKFTFVRNPFDRLVSAYFFLRAGGINQADDNFFKTELTRYNSFDHFATSWVSKKNVFKYIHFVPQVAFIKNDINSIRLNYIGRFESIDADFRAIAEKVRPNSQLAKLNRSKRGEYQQYYSAEARKNVENVYKQDLENFGYDFN
jgi:hypothetical protein